MLEWMFAALVVGVEVEASVALFVNSSESLSYLQIVCIVGFCSRLLCS